MEEARYAAAQWGGAGTVVAVTVACRAARDGRCAALWERALTIRTFTGPCGLQSCPGVGVRCPVPRTRCLPCLCPRACPVGRALFPRSARRLRAACVCRCGVSRVRPPLRRQRRACVLLACPRFPYLDADRAYHCADVSSGHGFRPHWLRLAGRKLNNTNETKPPPPPGLAACSPLVCARVARSEGARHGGLSS